MELLTKVGLTKLAGAKHCCHSVGDEEQKFSNIGVRDGFNKKRNRRISDDSCVSLRLICLPSSSLPICLSIFTKMENKAVVRGSQVREFPLPSI
jgi:hypothetical protein